MWASGATLAHCTQRMAHSKSIDIIRTRFGCVRRVDEAEVRCETDALLGSMCAATRCIQSATCARAQRLRVQASNREALFRVAVADDVREQIDIPPRRLDKNALWCFGHHRFFVTRELTYLHVAA